MPIHDWSKVDPNLYHHFHQAWSLTICNALNGGLLPKGFSALVEQHSPVLIPDVLAVESSLAMPPKAEIGGVMTAPSLPKIQHSFRAQKESMARRANRITVRHSLGRIVCVIEIVSPGNKQSQKALRAFVEKSIGLLENDVNLLVIDLFPPTKQDPHGIHQAIWEEIEEMPFDFTPDKPLTLAAYVAGLPKIAQVQPVAVGDVLLDMPAYLDEDHFVLVPLEATYLETWRNCPDDMRAVVEVSGKT